MAWGRVNIGGGAGLNFRVFNASILPASGRENDICVITATAIGNWQINCVAAPTVRSDGTALQAGDLYMTVSYGSAASFNALKKNALYGLPITAYQYENGAWAYKDSYVYQSGTWKRFLPAIGTPLENCTWEQIDAIGAAGLASNYFDIGDEKAITLSTNEAITLQIIGFAHDDLVTGGKAPITFCFKNCMNTKRQLNRTGTNAGGYSGSSLYSTINSEIYNSLPADLRAVMKNVNKKTSAGSQSSSIVTTQEDLFLLSEVEIFWATTHAKPGEGIGYAFFTNSGTRIKKVSGVASVWWTRSPYGAGSVQGIAVSATGGEEANGVTGASGIVLGLCA